MIVFLAKYYYGAWQNLFQAEWPVRFLIEWILFLAFFFLAVLLIILIAKKVKLKELLVKVWSIGVREIVYLLGHEKDWAVTDDNRMIDWALEKLDGTKSGKRHPVLKGVLICMPAFIYFLAVFVDLPVAAQISDEYLSGVSNVKAFFAQIEFWFSKGYEQYPPLFVPTEEEVAVNDAISVSEERTAIVIRLNDRGKDGSNIRSEPDLNTEENIIGGVNKDSEILYGDEWTHDGKRYWIRVYVPADGIEGWLSGNLVDSEQLEEITGN